MRSQELNERIRQICRAPEPDGYVAFGGKPIAYFGWWWRDVDFDALTGYSFGFSPAGEVGFLEDNKWAFEYVHAEAEQWAEIKELLIAAAENPNTENLKAANNAIQALAPAKVETEQQADV